MKKITLTAVVFCIALFLFCCKTYKDNVIPEKQDVAANELSDYLNSAKGTMHNAPVPQASSKQPGVASTEREKTLPLDLHKYKVSTVSENVVSEGDQPVLTKKQERKALKALLKKKVAGDDEGWGIAIGLLILYVALGILIIVLLWVLISNSVNQSANNSSNGGSGSNSSGSGGSGSNSGCYVATMVYGSYDAPEVMVLRRFRDQTLSRSKAGRAFIGWYYSWSPGFVEKYHHLSWLHAVIKAVLNRFVKFLS
jgi:hypothetical protein